MDGALKGARMNPTFKPTKITERIWQGGYVGRPEVESLLRHGLTHILNLDFPYDRIHFDLDGLDIHVTEMLVHDMAPMSESDARNICAAIHRAVVIQNGRMYVHCNAGLSRSPTAVWLYLITSGQPPTRASEWIANAAQHLSAPDPVLVSEIDVEALHSWIDEPRWELWRRHPLRQGDELLGTFRSEVDAHAERMRQVERYVSAATRAGQPAPDRWHWILSANVGR